MGDGHAELKQISLHGVKTRMLSFKNINLVCVPSILTDLFIFVLQIYFNGKYSSCILTSCCAVMNMLLHEEDVRSENSCDLLIFCTFWTYNSSELRSVLQNGYNDNCPRLATVK